MKPFHKKVKMSHADSHAESHAGTKNTNVMTILGMMQNLHTGKILVTKKVNR